MNRLLVYFLGFANGATVAFLVATLMLIHRLHS